MNELMMSQGSLRELAEQTGGIASVNTNSLTNGVRARSCEANSRYYVLGYYPPTHPRDGRFHKIEVRVKRPGLRVAGAHADTRRRAAGPPKSGSATKKPGARAKPGARTPTRPRPSCATCSPTRCSRAGSNFTVQAAPFKNTQKEASVALAIEIDGDRLPYAPPDEKGMVANKIELSFFGVNDLGKALAGTRSVLDLTLRPETRERVKANGVRVNPRINLPPGRYQLRIGAREAVGGLTGSVFYDLEVPDFRKEKLMMGGLLLTAAVGSADAEHSARSRCVAEAAARRGDEPARVPAQRHLALLHGDLRQLRLATGTALSTSRCGCFPRTGKEVFASRDELDNGGAPPEKPWEIYGYTKQIPLKDIPPGRYLLRVEAQVRGNVEDAKPVVQGDADHGRCRSSWYRQLAVSDLIYGGSMRPMRQLDSSCSRALLVPSSALMQEKGAKTNSARTRSSPTGRSRFPGTEGYTWGSTGGVFAETPDRVWIVQRGMLPLPAGAKFGVPLQGNATGAQSQKWQHCIFVVDRNGRMVQSWTQHDKIFAREGRARSAQDQDEPVRSAEARVDHGRQPAPALQVHL